jgi:N6-adenosine-specific RNA methylase IME4
MSVDEIIGLSGFVQERCEPDAHLYLWVTNNFLPAGLEVMSAWGFRYVTKVTWVKDAGFGLGQYYRGRTEDCLFGVRGHQPYKQHDDGKRAQGQTIIFAKPTEHSHKPEEMRIMIEKVSYGPYLEMFARARNPGWDIWGLEAPTTDIPEGRLL